MSLQLEFLLHYHLIYYKCPDAQQTLSCIFVLRKLVPLHGYNMLTGYFMSYMAEY